jgi:hypothetical protein
LNGARETADAIVQEMPNLPAGSLVVFGDIFGGRIDNIHTVVSAEISSNTGQLLVTFDLGEILEVWDPEQAVVGPNALKIAKASRVRWNWLYYGEADKPANHVYIDHNVVGARVEVSSSAPHRGPVAASIQSLAVEIVPIADWLSGRWVQGSVR